VITVQLTFESYIFGHSLNLLAMGNVYSLDSPSLTGILHHAYW